MKFHYGRRGSKLPILNTILVSNEKIQDNVLVDRRLKIKEIMEASGK